jgi:hypothetical protein
MISHDGLYVNLQGVPTRVPVIHNDGYGNYILAKELRFYCNEGHPSPNWDGYCAVPGCKYYRR